MEAKAEEKERENFLQEVLTAQPDQNKENPIFSQCDPTIFSFDDVEAFFLEKKKRAALSEFFD